MDLKVLSEIGLSESEKKVYLSLLDLGDSTRGNIVKLSGVTGSKVYELLEKLQEKGLVSIYIKDKVKHFKTTNPKQLLNYLEKKKEKISSLQKETESLLPNLLAKFNASKENQEVELITGLQGLENLFREQVEMLNKGDTCYVLSGTWGETSEENSGIISFFEKIHLMREKKKIKTKMLFNLNQKETTKSVYPPKKYLHTKIKYFNQVSPVSINVYNDRTIIIIFGEKIMSIHIRSKKVANSFIEHFNLLWKLKS